MELRARRAAAVTREARAPGGAAQQARFGVAGRRRDAPAGESSAGAAAGAGADEHGVCASAFGFEQQAPRGGEIDVAVGECTHHRRAGGLKRLFGGPQSFLAGAHMHRQQRLEVEPESREPPWRQPPLFALPGPRAHENQPCRPLTAASERQGKPEGRYPIPRPGGGHLMEGGSSHGCLEEAEGIGGGMSGGGHDYGENI